MTDPRYRLILASASPARLATLRSAGLDPEVIVSGVDEEPIREPTVPQLVGTLARLKAEAVLGSLPGQAVVIGCDSLLELDGVGLGKPGNADEARQRWLRMSGRSGVLHTGHHLLVRDGDAVRVRSATASTIVQFAELDSREIDAYVATGEPLNVAGAFTVDGLGGAFVTGIEGDHHNVVGISLPLLRRMLAELGLRWTDFWS